MRSSLLEIPSQLVEDVGLERRHQLIPDNLFGPLTDVRELRRHDDPSVHAGSARSRAAWRKRKTELIQPGIGDDVDDHAAAGGMNADRQAVGSTAPCGRHPRRWNVGQVPGSIRSNVVRWVDFPRRCRATPDRGLRRWRRAPSDAGWRDSASQVSADGSPPRRSPRARAIDVVDARAVVPAVAHRGVAEPHELVENFRVFTPDDPAEARIDVGRRRRRGA